MVPSVCDLKVVREMPLARRIYVSKLKISGNWISKIACDLIKPHLHVGDGLDHGIAIVFGWRFLWWGHVALGLSIGGSGEANRCGDG